MSNDVRNTLVICGEADCLEQFRQSDSLKEFRRHAHEEDAEGGDGDASEIGWRVYVVTTNNVPATDDVAAVCGRWPQLDFELRWHDPNGAIAGRMTCEGAEVIEQIEFTPTLTDQGRFGHLEWAVVVNWASGREPGPTVLTSGDLKQIGLFMELDQALREPMPV